MKSIKLTPTHSTHAKARLMMSVRMALFGASLLPMGALAQNIEAAQSTQNSQETASQPSKSLERLASYYHAKPSEDARCQGVWIHPSQNRQSQTLAEQLGADTESDNHYDDTVDFLDDVAASDAMPSDDVEAQSSASSLKPKQTKPRTTMALTTLRRIMVIMITMNTLNCQVTSS